MSDADGRARRRLLSAGGARHLPPSWVLTPDGEGLRVQDLVQGTRLRLDGAAAADVLAGRRSPLLTTLARFEPALTGLLAALVEPPRPFERGDLLRGSGWGLLFVELTARCNEACAHCYADAGPERHEALARETVEAALVDAAALGFAAVQFTGGDPLLCPFLPALVAQAGALGLEVEIYTNGLALQGALWEALRPLAPAFAFSFYDRDPAVHDAITRTPGSQARTARAIARVLAAGLACRVGVIGLATNRAHVAGTVAYLRELGVDPAAIGVSFERAVGRGEAVAAPPDLDLAALGAAGATHADPGELWAGKALIAADGGLTYLASATPMHGAIAVITVGMIGFVIKIVLWRLETRAAKDG